MKKATCIVGASLLTPVCVAILYGILFGIQLVVIFLCNHIESFDVIALSLFAVAIGVAIWPVLYRDCIDHWTKEVSDE